MLPEKDRRRSIRKKRPAPVSTTIVLVSAIISLAKTERLSLVVMQSLVKVRAKCMDIGFMNSASQSRGEAVFFHNRTESEQVWFDN